MPLRFLLTSLRRRLCLLPLAVVPLPVPFGFASVPVPRDVSLPWRLLFLCSSLPAVPCAALRTTLPFTVRRSVPPLLCAAPLRSVLRQSPPLLCLGCG